ncbi:MAG: family 10 glycosylhydrolase [Candidatus Aegiribacteria sp.]|nr:family 10 glycosylhydrolase [Candidatus Aegiribacteria sp.]
MHFLSLFITVLCSITGVWNAWQCNNGNWDEIALLLSLNGYDTVFYCAAYGPETDTEGLQECLDACNPLGIDVHAWVVLWKTGKCSVEDQDRFELDGRFQISSDGAVENWLCPTDPQNVSAMAQLCLKLAAEYPVSGIHLDYIRFSSNRVCFCDGCRERFRRFAGIRSIDWPAHCVSGGRLHDSFMQWRAFMITDAVQAVRDSLSRINRIVLLSVAGIPREQEMRYFSQEWDLWLRSGIVDFVVPMNYTESDSEFVYWGEQQMEIAEGRPLSCGIGSSSTSSTLTSSETEHQEALAEEMGFDGWVIFYLSTEFIDRLSETVQSRGSRPNPIRNQ